MTRATDGDNLPEAAHVTPEAVRPQFTSAPIMIQSSQAGTGGGILTIDIEDANYKSGTRIQGAPPGGGGTRPIQANQNWKVRSDPLGSSHYLIVSEASPDLCIGMGTDVPAGANATDDATDRFASLTLQAQEPVNNVYQLWDFLPPTGKTGHAVFIQNPQTGYVIELLAQVEESGILTTWLVAECRQITNPPYQLWTAVDQSNAAVALPVVSMAALGISLKGNSQYVLTPPNQGDHLTGITVTLDVIEDVVVDSFTVQINCNTPYLGPDGTDTEDYDRDAQWMQFGLYMSNNVITLWNQIWHRSGPVPASEFPSVTETSPSLLRLKNNTIPAGTRIIMNLCSDSNDFVIGITGLALDSAGSPIGSPVYWPAIGRDSFHTSVDGGKVHEKAMAPVGAFQVVFCSLPGNSGAKFTSGMGTITTTASPGIAVGDTVYNPFGLGTAENSDMRYDLVPRGTSRLIAQPFGAPSAAYSAVMQVAVASDATNGPLIAVLRTDRRLLVKHGSLTAGWNTEHTGVSVVAVASDATNGPLIAALLTDGTLLVKEGKLTAAWNTEHTGVSQVAVASDTKNGPLIAALLTDGTLLVKEGKLTAGWNTEHTGVSVVAVASDAKKGPLIAALLTDGAALVKEGSLTAGWNTEYS